MNCLFWWKYIAANDFFCYENFDDGKATLDYDPSDSSSVQWVNTRIWPMDTLNMIPSSEYKNTEYKSE